jgi:hypothetical protein
MNTSAHPYDPLNSKSAGLASNHSNLERDPLTTADTLTNGPLTQTERATPAEPPQRVAPSPHMNIPTSTANPTPGVAQYKPSYEEHAFPHAVVAVYNPEGDDNV